MYWSCPAALAAPSALTATPSACRLAASWRLQQGPAAPGSDLLALSTGLYRPPLVCCSGLDHWPHSVLGSPICGSQAPGFRPTRLQPHPSPAASGAPLRCT
jgi:hypothetical protein